MKKLFILILLFLIISLIVVGIILTGFNPFSKYSAVANKPTYDINNCENAKGIVSFGDFGQSSNKGLCYEERAYKLNDPNACFKFANIGVNIGVGDCVQSVSLNAGIYYCDKVEDKKQNDICNMDLMKDDTGKFHSLIGIEKHRIDKQVTVKDGDSFLFNNNIVIIDNNNGITFSAYPGFMCNGSQEPFLKVNTLGNSGQDFIYITDCSVKTGEGVGVIKYFKYDFSFLDYPFGI